VKPAGIILAAGESSRMGRDKALLLYQGSTFLNHLISILLPRVDPLIVVLGHHRDEIAASLTMVPGLRVLTNPDYKSGMLTSLQTGLRAVGGAEAILFTLVDIPAVRPHTIDRIAAGFSSEHPALVIPRYNARRGHPVLLSRRVAEAILALPPQSSAKDVIHAYRQETKFIDVDDPGVLRDIDRPADYEELMREREDEALAP
jgi:molybdenum cofactor cytidylyltransferase